MRYYAWNSGYQIIDKWLGTPLFKRDSQHLD